MKNNILRFGLSLVMWVVYTLPAMAQPVEPPTDDDPLEDPTPIDEWAFLFIILSIAIGIYFLTTHKREMIRQ